MSQRFALLIGNGEYDDPRIERLATPSRDVRALTRLLLDPDVGGFAEVLQLVDEPETRIRRAISAFLRGRQRDDLLLLYFSGHGIKDDRGRLYWAARDTAPDDLAATAVPAAYVSEHMDQSRSKRQVLVLDCCYSGAFAAGTKGDSRVVTQSTFEGTGYGRVVLTASDSTQYALEGDRVVRQAELSLFTHFLIEGLETGAAARPGASAVTLDDWYEYAYERVVGQFPSQTPCKWGYNQQGELIIAHNPRPKPVEPAALPPELAESLADARPWVRLGAVHELSTLRASGSAGIAAAADLALRQLAGDDSIRVRDAATGALAGAPVAATPTAPGDTTPAAAPEREPALPRAARPRAEPPRTDAPPFVPSRSEPSRSESSTSEPSPGDAPPARPFAAAASPAARLLVGTGAVVAVAIALLANQDRGANPEPDTAAISGPTTDTTAIIDRLGARVTAMRFFESPRALRDHAERSYATTFDAATARFIAVELDMAPSAPLERDLTATASCVYTSVASGETTGAASLDISPKSGWTTFVAASGLGDDAPAWAPGSYRVECSVDGAPVARGTFAVTGAGPGAAPAH